MESMNHLFRHLSTKTTLLVVCFWCACFAIADDLQGTLLVVNKKADSLSFIDIASKTIVTTQSTGKGPHELAISNDGQWAVVTDYVGGNSLSIYHIETAKKIREIDLSQYPQPHGVLFLSDQTRVAVSSEGSDSVVIANIHTGEITQVLATQQKGSHMVAQPADTKKIYTTNMRDNTVTEIDVPSGKILRQLPMPETPEAITISADGKELWVGSNKEGLVTVYDLMSEKLIKQWTDFTWPYRILLTKDQQIAVIPDFRQDSLDIISVTEKNTLQRVQFDVGTTPNGVTFYPDDRTLFMSAYGKNLVHVIDISTGKRLFTLPTGDGPDGIGYSPLKTTPSLD